MALELFAPHALFALHNGKPAHAVSIANRGFAYGDGLFETVKVLEGRAQFLKEHVQRLQRDCARLDIDLNSGAIEREIAWLLSARSTGILKIIITRNSAPRGYAAIAHAPADRFVLFYPQRFADDTRARDGVAVRVCRQRLSEQRALAGIKHLNRLEQVLARAEWSDSAVAEGLMLDTAGRLVEGTMSNIFLVRAGRVITPRLHRCGVAGVMRAVIMERLSAGCAPVIEGDLTLDDVYTADEVFLSNSAVGIWPVRKIECIHKAVGDVTIAFQSSLAELIAAHSSR